jgi:hypothetical protein
MTLHNNGEHDDLGAQLTRELHRRTAGMHDTPLGFDAVRGKATSIRRRRQLATGLGVAAAVAVIVPTAMFATKGTESNGPMPVTQPPTVSDTNSPTPTSTPTMGSDPHALDVSDLPTGPPPGTLVITSGDSAVAESGEALVRWTADGIVVEAGSRTFGPYPSSFGLVRNSAATAVAWTTDEGEVMAWADGESEPFVLQDTGLDSVRVGAVTGTDCTRQASECTFYVSAWDYEADSSQAFTLTSNGDVGAVDPDRLLISVRDAIDDGRVLGYTEINDLDPSSCSAVLDPAESGSRPLWETCKHTLDTFSPNGDYVLASDVYADGIGAGHIAVYDATTGEVLADRMNRGPQMVFYNDAVWEDETHVLFTAYQDGAWSVVRMNVDGAMEYAIAPQKGGEMRVPWHFATR